MKFRESTISLMCAVFLIGCSDWKIQKRPMWSATKTIALNENLTIGTDDLRREEYVFGNISDIKTDIHGNIYVADAGLFRISKYSSDGTLVRSFGSGYGRGPGQFMRLMQINVDAAGNVYATGYHLRRLVVFDSTGTTINTIQMPMKPGQLVIGKDGFLYVIGNPMSYTGPLIHKYRPDGSFVKAFCERDGIPDLALKSGNFGWLASDKVGDIYYTAPYPYEIRKFSSEGELLARFTRHVPFFAAPFVRTKGEERKVWIESGTMDLLSLPDGKLMHLIYQRDRNRLGMYPKLSFDIFSPEGNWLLNVPIESFGFKHYGALHIDRQGYFYVNHKEPYSRVTKYSLSFEDVVRKN